MPLRTKILIAFVIAWAAAATVWAARYPSHSWFKFGVFLTAILLSSGLKAALPKGEGSMSLNFPFILLAIMQLSPLQAILLAVSVRCGAMPCPSEEAVYGDADRLQRGKTA